jgi:two-component system cell cycle sensor histidine kinase/response regulator CckA
LATQILNVDDIAQHRERRSEILRARGYAVAEATNGREAVDVAMISCPDVILVGVNLPDISGIEVCRQIKTHPPSEHAVVILVAASELASDVVLEGFAAGADMCLRDGLEAGALVGFIDAAMRRRHTVAELQHDSSQAQLELGETLRRYRSMFEHAPYGIYHVLEDGTVLDGNRAFVELLGCSSLDEARLVNMNSVYEDPAVRPALVTRWRTKGTRKDEIIWLLPDGRRIHVALSGRVLEQNAEVFEVFVEDITERKRLEADFHHKRKMEAIGRLAGGIAHDLNNWLTVIVGYAEMLQDDASDPALREGLQEILSASRASTGITKNLLTFSRKQVIRLQTIDLNQVVSEFHQLVQRIIGEQIDVGIEVPSEPVRTKADPTQIQQVLMNLAVNARDAMPQGGRLLVETGNTELLQYSLPDNRVEPGSYAFILVRDTGVGMSAEVRERLFEPFFTTKEAGKGTGLGMAVVYGVVKQLGGYITVDSKPGIGTTFTMYFPAADADVPRTGESIAPSVLRWSSTERIRVLLVEDEEPVRMMTKRFLERAGYEVVTAVDAEEALGIFEDDAERIGLVLTDVVMPGMSGPDMLSRMLTDRQVPALLMSGYPDVGDLVAASGQFRLIAKPFTADVLMSAIREALERAHGSAASR